jgi:hypothetical protein
MKVFVEGCCGQGFRFYHRLLIPYRGRIVRDRVSGYNWTRATARQALDLLEHVYGLPRRAVRFVHR